MKKTLVAVVVSLCWIVAEGVWADELRYRGQTINRDSIPGQIIPFANAAVTLELACDGVPVSQGRAVSDRGGIYEMVIANPCSVNQERVFSRSAIGKLNGARWIWLEAPLPQRVTLPPGSPHESAIFILSGWPTTLRPVPLETRPLSDQP